MNGNVQKSWIYFKLLIHSDQVQYFKVKYAGNFPDKDQTISVILWFYPQWVITAVWQSGHLCYSLLSQVVKLFGGNVHRSDPIVGSNEAWRIESCCFNSKSQSWATRKELDARNLWINKNLFSWSQDPKMISCKNTSLEFNITYYQNPPYWRETGKHVLGFLLSQNVRLFAVR